MQPIRTMLRTTGRAAVMVPDNVLFFDKHAASQAPWPRQDWFYDYRSNIHHTLKKKPPRCEDRQDFIACKKFRRTPL